MAAAVPRAADPSRVQVNPSDVELEEPTPADAFDEPSTVYAGVVQHGLLRTIDEAGRLRHWLDSFEVEASAFKSKALLVEMRLRQALQSSRQLGVPNAFRTAIVCDAYERVAPFTGRLEGMLGLVWRELAQSIYSDYTERLPGSGAQAYAERRPWYEMWRLVS